MTGDRIGFVGLGNMGLPMASRLIKCGHSVTAFDLRSERGEKLRRTAGGEIAKTLGELAANSDTIVTILPNSAVVQAAIDQLQPSLRRGSIIVEMSSGVPKETVRMAELLGALGIHIIDAPVSGGVAKAETGELAIMVGGDPPEIERCRPVLETLGRNITVTGRVGSAQAMKALNNLVSAAGLLISLEALAIGQRYGLDPAMMIDVLNASTGMNNSTQNKLKPFVLSRSFGSGFALDLMSKDLGTALSIARDTKTVAPFSTHCEQLWAAAQRLLMPGADHTEIARLIERMNGLELGKTTSPGISEGV